MALSRFLVTGADGFVGAHMLTALRAAFPDAHITAATHVAAPDLAADTNIVFNLHIPPSIDDMVHEARPEACIHLAALSHVGASFIRPDTVWSTNVDGTRNLARAILAHAPDCILLNAGSADIYGLSFRAGSPLDETALPQPANPYAASKAAADLALGELSLRGLHVIRMRPLNHIGPGQSRGFAVAAFARQIAQIEAGLQPPIIRTGSLDSAREFLDVRDVCRAYIAVLQTANTLAPGTIFNLSSEIPRTLRSVLTDLLDIAGIQAEIQTEQAILRPTDLETTRCCALKLRQQTGWAPVLSWNATLQAILTDWRSQPEKD